MSVDEKAVETRVAIIGIIVGNEEEKIIEIIKALKEMEKEEKGWKK